MHVTWKAVCFSWRLSFTNENTTQINVYGTIIGQLDNSVPNTILLIWLQHQNIYDVKSPTSFTHKIKCDGFFPKETHLSKEDKKAQNYRWLEDYWVVLKRLRRRKRGRRSWSRKWRSRYYPDDNLSTSHHRNYVIDSFLLLITLL